MVNVVLAFAFAHGNYVSEEISDYVSEDAKKSGIAACIWQEARRVS